MLRNFEREVHGRSLGRSRGPRVRVFRTPGAGSSEGAAPFVSNSLRNGDKAEVSEFFTGL
jgi:hypothetical protein